MDSMKFNASTKNGEKFSVEVYWDDQPGVEPGWCWRELRVGGDAGTIDDVEREDANWALEQAKMIFA